MICIIYLDESILRNELILVGSSSSPSSTPEVTSTPVDTLSPSTHQNEVGTQRTTTSHIQSSLGERKFDYRRYIIISFIFIDPNEWSTETVLSWFQFHKLDEYVDNTNYK